MIVESGIVMFLFMTGISIFLLLEMGVNNVGSQKRLVHYFITNPLKVEALILSLFCTFPFFILYTSYYGFLMGRDTEFPSFLVTIVIGWPVLSYAIHRRIMDFKHTLGIDKKKVYDPVQIAKLSIAIWMVAAFALVSSFFFALFDILTESISVLIAFSGIVMMLIPFRDSLAKVRNQNVISEEELD
ncbi:MAG: hypothetical protein ACFFF9_12435 [Candidatus Thorarchaeota archaeon]